MRRGEGAKSVSNAKDLMFEEHTSYCKVASRLIRESTGTTIDEGSGGAPGEELGWEGDGTTHGQSVGEIAGEDEGYYSDNGEGFYEGAEGLEGTPAGDTIEAIVLSCAEKAAAIGEGAVGVSQFGSSTLTAGSFLAFIWKAVEGGGKLHPVYQVPKESIHRVTKAKTKTKTKDTSTSTHSSSSNCPIVTNLNQLVSSALIPLRLWAEC